VAYFYVKSSLGTRTTGGGTTKQTGTFASLGAANVYATITLAITDGAAAGDYICVSDSHAHSQASTLSYTGPITGAFLTFICVEDANCDVPTIATTALEENTSGDCWFVFQIHLIGMYFKTKNAIQVRNDGATTYAENSTLENTEQNLGNIRFNNDGCTFIGINSHIKNTHASNTGRIYMNGGASMVMIGGSINYVNHLHNNIWNGGGMMRFYGVDLSTMSGTLFTGVGAGNAEGLINVLFQNCKMHSSMDVFSETIYGPDVNVILTNSAATSAAAESQYWYSGYGGDAEDIDTIYRDGSTAFPSGTKISLKCTSTTLATRQVPLSFDMPTRYAELSNPATDTLRIYILSSATLYDSDVWTEVIYPDGINKHVPNYLSNRHGNVLDTNGTELVTNTEAWTGRTAENRYQIDLDTSDDAGADSVPLIRVYVAKASATIYFCTSIDSIAS